MPSVKSARSRIDSIDDQILELLASRLKLARGVGASKAAKARKQGKSTPTVLVPEREETILRRLHSLADARRLPWPLVQEIYTEIIGMCRAAQAPVTAHVLGPAGTHSEWAARARFGEALTIEFHDSIPNAIKAAERAVAGGDTNSVAVVPIENSLEGSVTATVDSLIGTPLRLMGEGYFRVRHGLLSRGTELSQIRKIYSHPMGLAQCRKWLGENLPNAKLVEVSSTALAAHHVRSSKATRSIAAIASPYLAGKGLNLLAADVQDSMENTTRFGILGPAVPSPSGDDKTAIVFSLPNKAGSLLDALQIFSKAKINLSKIESRPHRGLQWEYLFHVDLDGHAFDPRVTEALEKLSEKVRTLKILGAFPKGRPWN